MISMKETSGRNLVKYKFIYMVGILLLYLIGKRLPLAGIDRSLFTQGSTDAEGLMMQVLGSDANMSSIFALGITPSMFAGILVQMSTAFRSREKRAKTSPKVMAWATVSVTFIIAVGMAVSRVQSLPYPTETPSIFLMTFDVIQMVSGAAIIQWLISRNKRFGLGGQSALIYINVADGLMTTILSANLHDLIHPIALSVIAMIVMVFMENGEIRIPVKRIGIHNIYGDKNYLAFKFNPIGVMPIMFASAFFMIPKMIFKDLAAIFPNSYTTSWISDNMEMTKPIGAITYLIIYFLLSIFFSFVFLSPRDLTEQYLKSGDIIPGVHPDKPTKKYLSRILLRISIISGLVMGTCLGLPLAMQIFGLLDSSLMMMPSTAIMLTGIFMTIRSEIKSLMDYDSYKLFI